MSADFGAGSIISACNLCYQIYDRCKSSQGEFKDLSDQARSLRVILKNIEKQNMTAENLASLKVIVEPLVEKLNTTSMRLRKYSSLGSSSSRISDQIGWALGGGSAEIRRSLSEQVQVLTLFHSALGQQQFQPRYGDEEAISFAATAVKLHEPSDLLTYELDLSDKPLGPSTSPEKGFSIGIHSIGQGIRFLLFVTLSLLAFGFILAAGGLYVAALILFPFVELPTLYKKAPRHWQEFNLFSGNFFNRMWGFIKGLWE